jgi:peptidoglycan/xylan/chitin deacetylase (PgdA/CDA1 family)
MLYMALEQWGEENVIKYQSKPRMAAPIFPGMKMADLAITSTVEYGLRVGVYRLLEIFESFGVKPTLLSNGWAIERYPDLFKELDNMGYSIVLHAWDQSRWMWRLSGDDLRNEIRKCVDVARDVTGQRPLGWGSPATRQYKETIIKYGFGNRYFH